MTPALETFLRADGPRGMVDVPHLGTDHVAFRARRQLRPGDVVAADAFEHIDGVGMVDGEEMRCDGCGAAVTVRSDRGQMVAESFWSRDTSLKRA